MCVLPKEYFTPKAKLIQVKWETHVQLSLDGDGTEEEQTLGGDGDGRDGESPLVMVMLELVMML